jgi:hypothetical protein
MSMPGVLQSGSGGVGLTRYVQVVVLRGAGSNPACRNDFDVGWLTYMLCIVELVFLLKCQTNNGIKKVGRTIGDHL